MFLPCLNKVLIIIIIIIIITIIVIIIAGMESQLKGNPKHLWSPLIN